MRPLWLASSLLSAVPSWFVSPVTNTVAEPWSAASDHLPVFQSRFIHLPLRWIWNRAPSSSVFTLPASTFRRVKS